LTARLASLLSLLVAVWAGAADASDLGTAGAFRSFGGTSCNGPARSCAPPPVDAGLPPTQQVRAHVARARALLDLVLVTDASAALGEALRLAPDDVEALTLRGRLALTEGNAEAAQVDIDHGLSVAPDDPDLLATRGAMAFTDCECRQALTDLDRALKVKPDDVDALFIRAGVYFRLHDATRAFTDLTENIAIRPADVRARIMRAALQLSHGDFTTTALDADAVIAAEPGNMDAILLRAKAREGLGDDAGAVAAYSALLDGPNARLARAVPQLQDAMLARARLNAKLDHVAEAGRDITTLLNNGGQKQILRLQLFLRSQGYPNLEISGVRSTSFDSALMACFADRVCGPQIKP
jgi:Tfp pilus assembly protein PilF